MKKVAFLLILAILLIIPIRFFTMSAHTEFKVLVLHDGSSKAYLDTFQHFSQSLVTDLSVKQAAMKDISSKDLGSYQLIYLTDSLAESNQFNEFQKAFMDYAKKGGSLFLENKLYSAFPKDFLGASGFERITAYPEKIQYPNVRYNLKNLQGLIKDFSSNYVKFKDFETLKNLDYGYGLIPTTAETLASSGSVSLYALNRTGDGYVFFTNPLLPNASFINAFDMTSKGEAQKYYNPTVATANFLFKNEFAAFIEKEKRGYVLKKVMGIYGRPAMAWQNHYEALPGIQGGSLQKWTEFLKGYQQIPSFSLIRESYDWGTWKESVAYQLNTGTNASPKYIGEEEGSQYSSGRSASVDGQKLTLAEYPVKRSLSWSIDLPYRSSPAVGDLDGDGKADLISGSASGNIYFYKSKGYDKGWNFDPGIQLTYEDHSPIQINSYSAPILYDYNKDGKADLVVGSHDGNVYLLLNQGGLQFSRPSVLIPARSGISTVSADIGDLDGDGTDDMVMGDAKGDLYFCKGMLKGQSLQFSSPVHMQTDGNINIQEDKFAAPQIIDYDGDGKKDIVVGTNAGFIKKLKNTFPYFEDQGYIEAETYNPFGDHRLWTGHNSVPCYSDINGDGKLDLVTGQLEFGMAIPIDSPSFPYKEELKAQVLYAKNNYLSIIPHFFTHNYKGPAQEQKELELQKKSFAYYGLSWDRTGINQHTSRINALDQTQTFHSEMKAGIWWNSGFKPPWSPSDIGVGTESSLNIPFLLSEGEHTQEMILFNAAPSIAQAGFAYGGIARNDLPVSYFRHIEYDILNSDGQKSLGNIAGFLDKFRDANDYNFMREDQMFNTFLSTMQTQVHTVNYPGRNLLQKVENKLRTKQSYSFYIDAAINSTLIKDNDIYQNTSGVKLEAGEKYLGHTFHVDSEIYMRKGHDLYFSIGKKVKVTLDAGKDSNHIVRVNVPVKISGSTVNQKVEFLDSGMQQIKIYAPKGLLVSDKNWSVETQGEYYTLTRYGDKATLSFQYK